MESGRGSMSVHKHFFFTGHRSPDPANMMWLSRVTNAATDARAAQRDRRGRDGMAGSVAALFSPAQEPKARKKRSRIPSRKRK